MRFNVHAFVAAAACIGFTGCHGGRASRDDASRFSIVKQQVTQRGRNGYVHPLPRRQHQRVAKLRRRLPQSGQITVLCYTALTPSVTLTFPTLPVVGDIAQMTLQELATHTATAGRTRRTRRSA